MNILILFNFSQFLIGYQILLLSGPPGLGKTTLAYVVARQAGYEVMEINARLATCQIHVFTIF
jgi:replication-associated recombination protein RarA